jgi:hypothetical protein
MQRIGRPNFFIVGAPKSGTTALYTYLRQHPDVFLPSRKEPHFFCPDIEIRDAVRDDQAYLSLFSGASSYHRIGEASVWYLYSSHAAKAIKSFNPHARIIIMLRDPIEMIHALYHQRLKNGDIDDIGLEAALSNDTPPELTWKKLLVVNRRASGPFGIEVGRYAMQVQRYLETFGLDKVLILLYDDFAKEPRASYRSALHFLGLKAVPDPPFEIVNANKRIHSVTLHRMIRTPSAPLRAMVRAAVPRPIRQRLAERLVSLNSMDAARKPLPPELRMRLCEQLSSDIEKLSELIGRNLAHWLVSGSAAVKAAQDCQPLLDGAK